MPRGFPPHRIRQWTDVAHELAASDSTVDVALVVAYSAWEALQGRILAVALYRQGFSISVAHEFSGSTNLNDRKTVKQQFQTVLGRDPQQITGVSSHWRALNEWSHHRNGLVHGLSTYSPVTLRAGVSELAERLHDPSWLAALPVPRQLGGDRADAIPCEVGAGIVMQLPGASPIMWWVVLRLLCRHGGGPPSVGTSRLTLRWVRT